MMKLLLSVLLLVTVTVPFSYAQISKVNVTGVVKTTDGIPAEYVSVALKDTYYGAATDTQGKFSFEAPAGTYTLLVFTIGEHVQEHPVVIHPDSNNYFPDLTVLENNLQLQEVVVTGQFSPQSLRNSLYRVKVIGPQQIQQKAATDVQSLLNTEIGIRLSNDMALGETDLELMGMSGNNVKVMIDGVPMIDRGSTKQSLSQIDINSIERVEIVEGPMSVVYGTDALAGVINIITRKNRPQAAKDVLTIGASIQEESVGKEYAFFNGKGIHRENISLGWAGRQGYYVNGALTRNTTGGWKGDYSGREKQWQPKDQYLYSGTVGWSKKGLNVWYRLDYLNEKIKNPSNPTEANPNQITDRDYQTDRYTHQLQADWKASNRLSVNLATSYQDYERRTRTVLTNTETGEQWLSITESSQDTSSISSWFARATAAWIVHPKLSLQPGAEYQWNKGNGDRIEGSPSMSDLAVFLSAEYKPWNWMNVRPGLRSIVNSDYNAPAVIPALVTKFSLTQHMELRASYAYGFRSPTLRELYFSFHNANHNIDGNPDLKAEYSNNLSLAYTWRILHDGVVRLTTTLTGFYNDFRDRIDLTVDKDDASHYTYYNYDRYKTTGGTWENALAWRDLTANMALSVVGRYNRYSKEEAYKDQSLPQFRFSPEVSANVTYRLTRSGTDFNLYYKYTGKRHEYAYDSDNGELILRGMNSYHWADLTVTQRLHKFLNLQAGVKNLFDVTTVRNSTSGGAHNVSTGSSLVGCGRSFFVGLNFNFMH